MSAIEMEQTTRAQWVTWTSPHEELVRAQHAEVESTGTPADRAGASIVDDFAEDLRQLADA